MRFLKIIRDKDIDPKIKTKPKVKYQGKITSRGVIFNNKKKIALLYVRESKIHMLPGGKKRPSETIQQALKRESREEIGYNIKISRPIGIVKEYRGKTKDKRISYCHFAEIIGPKKKTYRTISEIKKGIKVQWASLDKALLLLRKDKPRRYAAKFVLLKELTFLEKAKEMLKI